MSSANISFCFILPGADGSEIKGWRDWVSCFRTAVLSVQQWPSAASPLPSWLSRPALASGMRAPVPGLNKLQENPSRKFVPCWCPHYFKCLFILVIKKCHTHSCRHLPTFAGTIWNMDPENIWVSKGYSESALSLLFQQEQSSLCGKLVNISGLVLAQAWGADYFSLGSRLPVGGVRQGKGALPYPLGFFCSLCSWWLVFQL